MKKITAAAIALSTVLTCVPAVSANGIAQNAFGEQTIPASNLSAFEGGYKGYVKSMDVFEGRSVHVLKRDGTDETETDFCYYRWGIMPDENGEYIPLSTANFIVIDYYYDTPDPDPALEGAHMRWNQVRIVPDSDISKVIGVGTNMASRNGIIANEWDQLIIPVNDYIAETKEKYSDQIYLLHQMKLFPLETDMGKDDTLYISDITVQSWDPSLENSISDRTLRFFASEADVSSPEKAIATATVKDLEYATIPAFTGTAPENTEFIRWKNTFDGKNYRVGESMQMLAGQDINFVPVFNYVFNFAGYENAYINGYTDGTFLPQNNVTRAEAAKIVASLVNPEGKNLGGTAFTDVAEDAWYYNAVTTLENLGALEIWSGTFEPNTPITRSELVEIVYGIADTDFDSMRLSSISDVSPEDRYFDAVMYAVSEGIITGYEDGTFKPANNITRAETVTIINRLLGRVSTGTGANKFSDIADHWAKDQIIASSSSKAEGAWTVDSTTKEYVISGTTAEEYIKALHAQSAGLSGDAIRRGIDVVSEQMKKDILSTPNTAEIYGDRMTGFTYYVSEKNGSDDNDGRSPEKAFKTIAGLNSKLKFPKAGTSVLFERGGVYRGSLNTLQGVIYGSYGEGDKPIISGSLKNYADASLWKTTDKENVYELTDKLVNVGVITFDHAQNAHGNYDGLYGTGRIYGKNISDYTGLSKDLEFFSCKDTLYLYCEGGNPGERFSSIEIGAAKDIISGSGKNVIIDNLHVKHTGTHGLNYYYGENLIVTNCEFSWIGGSLLGSYGQTTGQYGNAVQIYGSCDGFYVKNNWMYQIYDTAITHQGVDYTMNNIEYSGNLMEYVHWGIECWITKDKKNPETNNYLANYNVMRNGGYGWGTIVSNRASSARLYSFTTVQAENSNLRSEYNIIDRCAGYLIDIDSKSSETFSNYIYVQDEGKTLGRLRGNQMSCTKGAAANVEKYLEDEGHVFVFIPR